MENIKIIAKNKKAQHNYFILRKIECGIELFGTEVKSIRLGKVNISEAYAQIDDGEVFVTSMNISPYEQGNVFNRDPLRPKKLLLHKNEIRTLIGESAQNGYALIPLCVYLKDSLVKLELGVCKGKKLYDKRNDLKEKSAKRDIDRAIKEKNK
ncbi:MAG: SsrA-binding protein SmpB [Firmicutes bacterium]|nr:SsrA-binding protein SmpB [Bacillota bacterium]